MSKSFVKDMPKDTQVNLRVSPEEKREWQTIADLDQRTLSSLIRVALDHYKEVIATRKNLEEIL